MAYKDDTIDYWWNYILKIFMNGGNVMTGKRRMIFIVFCMAVVMFFSLTVMGGGGEKSKGGVKGKEPPPGPIANLINPDVPRVANLELASMIGDPDIVIIDIDKGSHWGSRKLTIKGAIVRGAAYFEPLDNFIEKYPKDKTYVFYCG